MFIDGDINKDNVHLHLNQSVKSHYEIEDFRDYKSTDAYLQQLISDCVGIEEEISNRSLQSLMEELSEFEEEINNYALESLLQELSEI